jgi:hypothetical protein
MVLEDWCFCPVSKCPALFSEYMRYIEMELDTAKAAAAAAAAAAEEGKGPTVEVVALDPVHRKPVTAQDLRLCTPEEATAYIKKYNNVIEEKKKKNEESKDADDDDEEKVGDENTADGKSKGKNGSLAVSPSRDYDGQLITNGIGGGTLNLQDYPDAQLSGKGKGRPRGRNFNDDF